MPLGLTVQIYPSNQHEEVREPNGAAVRKRGLGKLFGVEGYLNWYRNPLAETGYGFGDLL